MIMRSTNEQLREIMQRAEIVSEKRNIRKHIAASALSSCVCLFLLVIVSVYLPHVTPTLQDHNMQQYGSLLLAAPYMGYVVVGVIAFALGICVTLLCIHLKALKQRSERDDECR